MSAGQLWPGPGAVSLGRREFFGVAGALIAGAVLPLSLEPPRLALAASVGERELDDAWGHWPRYAHPIPHPNTPLAPLDWTQVDPIDRIFLT